MKTGPTVQPASHVKAIPWIIALVVAVAFGRVLNNGAAPVDDGIVIFLNPRFNPPRWTDDSVLWYWKHADPHLYIPLSYMAIAVLAKCSYVPDADQAAVHLDVRLFHAASLLLHIANTLLAYAIIKRLLRQPVAAAIGALFYGLHPLQVEAVSWVTGIRDLLCATVSLASILLYLAAVDPRQRQSSARKRRICYISGLILIPIGMLFKPTAITAPLIAAVIDRMILRPSTRQVARSIGPYLLAALPLVIVTKLVQPHVGLEPTPLWQRPVLIGATVAFYLGKLSWPTRLAYDYAWRPQIMLQKAWFWWISLVPVILGIILWMTRRKSMWIIASLAVLLCGLLPVLGFVSFPFQNYSTVADHYILPAMLGPAIAVAWIASRFQATLTYYLTISAVLLILTMLTVIQLGRWHTEADIARQMVAVAPTGAPGHGILGEVFAAQDNWKIAEQEFLIAQKLRPDLTVATDSLARMYADQHRTTDAISELRILASIFHDNPQEMKNLNHLAELFATLADRRGAKADADLYRKLARQLSTSSTTEPTTGP